MNHAPQQSKTITSQPTKAAAPINTDTEMEIACIDLVCQLEHQLAVAKEGYRDVQVGESDVTSERMLKMLIDFSEAHLLDDMEDIRVAMQSTIKKINEHRKVVKSQSWKHSFVRVFFDSVDENSVATHTQLGVSMAKVCATVFVATIQRLGSESSVVRQVEQSMELFVEEFTKNW